MADDANSDTPANMVTLKNGETVPKQLVNVMVISLEELIKEDFIAFYELVMACRDHNHVTYGDTHEVLERLALIEGRDDSGKVRIHDLTRSVVLSAVEGKDFQMRLVNPIAA